MLTREIKSQSIPAVHLTDKVYQVLQLMNDNQVTHLPIIEGETFVGIISENDLLQADNDHAVLRELQQSFAEFSVKEDEHFLKAVQLAGENGLSIVPIVNEENILTGVVSYETLLKEASSFMSLNEPGGLIVLEIESNSYSFNEISQ
ncbi:MAG TPA: CBS domain-containing protein, partial [Chitinophagaceae bacterium]|nr:CBS domain-containing protein [Chitinophagaceae bacterium]